MNKVRDQHKKAIAAIEDGRLPNRYCKMTSQEFKKAKKQYEITRAVESERESMCALTQEIYNLTESDTQHSESLKHYFSAKQRLLQAGFELAISLRELRKSLRGVQKETMVYETQRDHTKHYLSNLTRKYKSGMMSIIEQKRLIITPNDSLERFAMSEKCIKNEYEKNRMGFYKRMIRFAKELQNVSDTHKKACLKVEVLQKEHASAESVLDDAFNEECTKYMEKGEYECFEEEHLGAKVICVKCAT